MRGEYKIVLLASILWIASSQNIGVISFSLKSIINDLAVVSGSTKSLLASAQNIGMLVGALISGPIADRIGRSGVIKTFTFLHAVSTLLSGLSPDVNILIGFRFLIGLGVGGALPIIASLVAEYSSMERRGRNISSVETFWAVGWLSAVILAFYTLNTPENWRIYMIVAGLLSLILVVLSSVSIPESIRYLLSRGRKEEAERLMETYGVDAPRIRDLKLSMIESLGILLSKEYRLSTLSLWITWFSITMGYYGIFIWLPTLISAGSPEISEYMAANRFIYLIIITLAQLPGYLSAVYLVDKIGRKKVLSIYLIMTALSSYFFAVSSTVLQLYISGIILSFFDLGAWAALYTYTPEQYPTHIRGMGSSWASSIGRVGGILGALIVPWLGGPGNWFTIFILFSLIHVVGGLAVFAGRELAKMEMPEILVTAE